MPATLHFLPVALLALGACSHAHVEKPVHTPPDAPQDQPITIAGESAIAGFRSLLEPCRRKAVAAYPDARGRFQAGLPHRHTFFVVTRLRDARSRDRTEQVFIAVDRLEAAGVVGRLWSNVKVVDGYQRGQVLRVPDAEIVDWMISRPDGTEEGNWIGRFVDAYQAQGRPPQGICDP